MDHSETLPRRKSVRLKKFDYSQPGTYFVTICSRNKKCIFGKIVEGRIRLNAIGCIAHECWLEIPRHFPNVELRTHVVMPNYVHGLFVLHPGRRARHLW